MPDDGYGEVGGNGSVQWVFDVNNLIGHSMKGKGPKGNGPGHRTEVVADNGAHSEFTISVKIPKGMSDAQLKAIMAGATKIGNKLAFTIPIEKDTPDQIRVSWGS